MSPGYVLSIFSMVLANFRLKRSCKKRFLNKKECIHLSYPAVSVAYLFSFTVGLWLYKFLSE